MVEKEHSVSSNAIRASVIVPISEDLELDTNNLINSIMRNVLDITAVNSDKYFQR